MSKDDFIKMDGVVVEILRNTTYRVKLTGIEQPVLASLNGRMRQNNIKVLAGDTVEMEFSPYDVTRGRIVRRR